MHGSFGTHIFPIKLHPWKVLRTYQKSITPDMYTEISMTGVRFHYIPALKQTISQILECAEIDIPSELTVTIKDGVDGSGGHAIYHQPNNEQTRNIVILPSKTKIPPVSGTAILPVGTTILPVDIRDILSKKSQILYEIYQVLHISKEKKSKSKFNRLTVMHHLYSYLYI